MDKSKSYALMLMLIILSAGLGYAVGKSSTKSYLSQIALLNEENTKLSSQVEKIKAKFPNAPEMSVLLGRVTEIGSGFLVMNVNQTAPNGVQIDFFEEIPMTRKVLIVEGTQIFKFMKRTSEELKADMDKYKVNNITAANSSLYNFNQIPISLNDIHEGDLIVVNAGKDVKTLSEFTASKIFLQNQ